MADERVSFSDLFDFNDSTSADKAIKIIEAIGKAYDQMAASLRESSRETADNMAKIKQAAKDLQDQVKKGADINFLGDATKEAEKNLISYKKLEAQQKAYQEQISKLESEVKKLQKAKQSIAKLNDVEANSLDDLKKRLQEAQQAFSKMGDASSEAAKAEALEKVTALNKEYQAQAKILNDAKKAKEDIAGANDVEASSVDDLKAKLKEAEAQYKKLALSAEQTAETELLKQAELDKIAKLGPIVSEADRAIRDAKKGVVVAAGSYNEMAREVAELNLKLRNLADREGKNAAEAKELERTIHQKTEALKKYDAAVSQNFRNVGNYGSALKGLGADMIGFGSAAAAFATIAAGFKSAIDANREFEKSLSSLSSITGAVGEDLEYYKQQAEDIGMTTTLSASQAVEAFKLMGSAAPELLKNREALAATTREAVTLAEAAGIELPQATQALASTMAQFNLPATEANRIINALAAGSKVGSTEIPQLTEAMDKAGLTAKNFNVSVEESVAAIEVLGKANIKGAEAGTALRNVLLTMSTVEALPPMAQEQMEKFGVDLSVVADKSIPVQERMQELAKITGDATAMVKVFGKENVNAAGALLQNIDLFEEYTAGVTGTNTAMEQASVNVDNLDGDVKSLSSVMDVSQGCTGFGPFDVGLT